MTLLIYLQKLKKVELNNLLEHLALFHNNYCEIAKNLLYKKDKKAVQDIVQEMYIKLYDQVEEGKIEIQQLIINDKPHFGIIKRTIQQIIQHTANNENKLPKDENVTIKNIIQEDDYNIEEFNNKVIEILNGMYWFDRKLFTLYVKQFNSIRKLAKETRLGHVTVYNTIKRAKKNIKKKLYEK